MLFHNKLRRDILVLLWPTVSAPPHHYKLAVLAARYGILLSVMHCYIVEEFVLDAPEIQNNQRKFVAALRWISDKPDEFFFTATIWDFILGGFPLDLLHRVAQGDLPITDLHGVAGTPEEVKL